MIHLQKQFEQLKIQLESIQSATKNFDETNCIGIGGFGKVYKGELLHSKGKSVVAIKRSDGKHGQGKKEFWSEIQLLSMYKHDHIVSLLGFCDDSGENILVYEYASRGSLDKYLNNHCLTWIQRLKICIGAARGLAYLHNSEGTQLRVLHRDIKSSNILLDENWNARISDLGLSKFGPANQKYSFVMSNAVGTLGYCDPQYAVTGMLTKESDVYSFGVVLFEILCGRLCIRNNTEPLIVIVQQHYKENKINELVYSNIKDEINPKSLELFTTIAYKCLNKDHEERPLMTQVVSMLENALEYQADADTTQSRKLPEIVDSSHLKAIRLPDQMAASKVMQLIYTNSGLGLLALASSAVHKLWTWPKNSSASVVPQLWQPKNGAVMSNHLNESKPVEESAACIALSKNDYFLMSASGGKVSLFNMMTFKVLTTFMPPTPAATFLAIHPQDSNIVAIGNEDSKIEIYNVRFNKRLSTLEGHQKQITGLAFSQALNSLVSSGADAQLCMWNIYGWKKLKSISLQSPPGYPSSLVGDTKVQYHCNERHLLVVHESQIAIYDPKMECLKLWFPRESLSAPITSAIYSCDSLLIFTGFSDGAVGVFDAENLRLRCHISISAYISPSISSMSAAYPVVIAAHPSEPNQFALGMSDGSVHVIEPDEADPKWGGSAPYKNSALV